MVGQTPQPPKVVARKMPKDELLLSRRRFLVVVEIVLGFSLLFVFGGALAFGISEPGGATASGGFLRTALLTGALAVAGVILFLRGLKRWWHISQSGSSVGYKRPDALARGLRYACPGCGGDVYHGQAVCPQCRHVLADSSASNR